MSLCSHRMWTMPLEYHRGQQGTSSWKDLPKGRNPLPSKMQEASEKVWSQSVVHYHFKLKNEILFMCVTKPSGVGMQFLVLEFLSSAQLDHTSMYNFENCSWVQGFLYLSHMYDNFYFFKNIIFKYINLLNFGKLPFNSLLCLRLKLIQN